MSRLRAAQYRIVSDAVRAEYLRARDETTREAIRRVVDRLCAAFLERDYQFDRIRFVNDCYKERAP